ncbi:MAG: hypothetical protein WCR06_04860 [bacterium]
MSSDDTIKLAKTGLPFKSEELAQAELKRLELSQEVWGVFSKDGGWVIRTFASVIAEQRQQQAAAEDVNRAKSHKDIKYFWVEFAGRSSPQDAEKVEITYEGSRITVTRETKVALPETFLGVCDNAVQRIFEPAPRGTSAYQAAGMVKRRAYRNLGEATREDFLKQWNEGNSITRRTVQSAGGKPHDVSQAPA